MNTTAMTTIAPLRIPLILEEAAGIQRIQEPVTVGIPFPKGAVKNTSELRLLDPADRLVPLQSQVLARWNDQSVKWVLFDFQATVAAHTTIHYTVCDSATTIPSAKEPPFSATAGVTVQENADGFVVDTGAAIFLVNPRIFVPFEQVVVAGVNMLASSGSQTQFIAQQGQQYQHVVRNGMVETAGPLRTTLKIEGELCSQDQSAVCAEFFARLHFYAQRALTRIDYTIRNPRAAKHPGGLWDLGDAGSIYFKDLSLHLRLAAAGTPVAEWTTQPEQPLRQSETNKLEIYQDSSGGENWQSPNHVNRFGEVAQRFCGYRVTGTHLLEEGRRAQPMLALRDATKRITGAVRQFWENFPKALEADENTLIIRLFPTQAQDLFELQGGEQKTHTVFLSFEAGNLAQEAGRSPGSLNWIQHPLLPHTLPEWYVQSEAFEYLTTAEADPRKDVLALINTAIEGDNTFCDRREIIDEYGWRNFGDLYADHEKMFYKGTGLLISHYNNQYDSIYGMIVQYVRSGQVTWFCLAHDLAQHVIDIDIYHTNQDKSAYNGGLFWHTDHYTNAATATHRSFSQKTMLAMGLQSYGGGPANEHNYTLGLLYHYYLTGAPASREAVLGLANWVVNMDDGTKTKFRFLNRRPTGSASILDTPEYHGPGRGAGYSINAVLDAYLLTETPHYLAKAEELIQRCIHPHDDIAAHNLADAENRWYYVVFLQVVGRYLDCKAALQQLDYMYCYARESLLHYAKWMQAHEVPFSTIFDRLEYPTETWPAQDLRKSNVFEFAAKYAPEPLRSQFLQKADFFFDQPLQDLFAFETKTLTRPLILLMTNSFKHAYWRQHPEERAPTSECAYDFGRPQKFKPQLYYAYKLRTWLYALRARLRRPKATKPSENRA